MSRSNRTGGRSYSAASAKVDPRADKGLTKAVARRVRRRVEKQQSYARRHGIDPFEDALEVLGW